VSRNVIRVGLIGAGQVAEPHAAAYEKHPRAQLKAVADPMLDRARRLAHEYDLKVFASYEDLLGSGLVDAVSVCVPHNLHLPVALAAASGGVHMLMEKPIANTLAEADEMITAVEEAGVTMMIGFVHRFRTEVLAARQLLDEGVTGRVATVLDRFCAPGGTHPPAWTWSKERAGGGVLMYGGIHAIDRLLWLLDTSATRVFARQHIYTGFGEGEVEDGLVAMLELANGATATLFENSPPYGRPGGWATEIFGPRGALRIQTGESLEVTTTSRRFTLHAHDTGHFDREIADFVDALIASRETSVPASVGRETLAVALAIYESAATTEPVELAATAAN
jgi:predicted dehydrogenase